MRIVIDLQGAQNNSRLRGIGRYCQSLLKALVRNNQAGHEILVVLNAAFADSLDEVKRSLAEYLPPQQILSFHIPGPVQEACAVNDWFPQAAKLLREQFLQDLHPDVVLIGSLFEGSYDDTVTSIGELPQSSLTAVIFYDLIPYINPAQFIPGQGQKKSYYQKIEYLKRADLLLAISAYAKTEAVDHLGLDPARIVPILSAADGITPPDAQLREAARQTRLQHLGITRPFVMHTSAYEPRKNFEGLIQAYARLPTPLRQKHQLVLVCKLQPKQRSHLQTLARQCGLQDEELILTGYLPDADLALLYAQCHLFVFPSLHEGFGLPPLEAMSLGAATIGSNSSSIPEVIGRADATFDPTSVDAIGALMTRALSDQDFWQSLKDHAHLQAQKFSWDQCAQKALVALEALVAAQPVRQRPQDYDAIQTRLAALAHRYKITEVELCHVAACLDQNLKTAYRARRHLNPAHPVHWRIEGPFDSSYSLALLNRETARALVALGHTVSLHSTEGPGDFAPDPAFLAAQPDLAELYARSREPAVPVDVVSRNLYPPRVHDMRGMVSMLHHYAWEESGFPQDWVAAFNRHLDGLTTLSRHVQKILIDHGVCVPMQVSGCGVDHWERIHANPAFVLTARSFRFLHISSCFPRKGIETLLNAYGQTFTQDDDVSLVIKTFPNPHHDIAATLQALRAHAPDYPDVVLIQEDLPEADLKALMAACHVLVAPSYAEGFGLPLAEALLSGLPVITTAWGGQRDFCDHHNSWLLDYQFAPAQSHFALFDSVWAVPDVKTLGEALHAASQTPPARLAHMAEQGRTKLLQDFRWKQVAQRCADFAHRLSEGPQRPPPKLAWITTYNTHCGIALYAHHLLGAWPENQRHVLAAKTDSPLGPDPVYCQRLWHVGKADNQLQALAAPLAQIQADMLVIQFNYGLFDFAALSEFVCGQQAVGRRVIMIMHATRDPYGETPNWQLQELREALQACERILVHNISDLNRLKALGLVDNVTLFPHGVLDYPPPPPPRWIKNYLKRRQPPLVASYGFCLPHKGLLELVEAAALLKQRQQPIRLLLLNAEYPVDSSRELMQRLQQKIQQHQLEALVITEHRFLPEPETLARLQQADLLVFAYQHTTESSSAAARHGMASHRPVAVSPLEIFDDLGESVFRLSGTEPQEIAHSLHRILDELRQNSPRAQAITANAHRWRETHRYDLISERLYRLSLSLWRNHATP
ncbi:glycosyltransferase [Thiorhodospira sibirica]|uniref:glycosyltransferase n=1 Tax=Thiorhodospira sibirica TaxID=154347 RepID=UPI00022C1114|nr:glycosyltransferase [Thiorhodospira sibirica]